MNIKTLTCLIGVFGLTQHAVADKSEQIEKGKYLAEMSDCYACHTIEGGEPYGGGLPFVTPFGTVYSTNITPDSEEGIGHYSYQDFYDALHNGGAPGGHLYPAMPYTSFTGINDDDTQALFAYFQSIKPSSQPNKDNDMMFPANLRFGLNAWNMLNLEEVNYSPVTGKSAEWNRGNYIVNTFGHCGECHTPRNIMMGMDSERHLQGAMIGSVFAPNITPAYLNQQGWSTQDIKDMLLHGYSRKGTVVGEMYEAIFHSLSKFDDDDLNAAAVYLLDSDSNVEGKALTFRPDNAQGEGREVYQAFCAHCHGYEGQGKPNYAPSMQGNGTLSQENHFNSVSAILYGIKPQYYTPTNAFYTMPGYDKQLSNEDLMHLLNYLTATYTENSAQLSVEQTKEIRTSVTESQKNATH
ncbi:cytochrome c [Vibrio methylphosphonaticus]|uniref:cytochrome c n=1 Tax=Vibrio methylphosphonaticus TaxID=2946866 RepID=UPI00202A9717|nr:c-type cytochrome [Vibrio methylphosphonaticus]MCL9773752.1 c-type cytochrome [Vibrio methylphosphonaticus]